MNILCLCTGNSCRSIMAEALLRHKAAHAGLSDTVIMSAGSQPTGRVHPRALSTLEAAGIDTAGLASTSWDDLPVKPDVVVTLCASAAAEACPTYMDSVLRLDWGMPDPDKAEGDEAAVQAAFDGTLQALEGHIVTFLDEYLKSSTKEVKQRGAAS